MGAISKKLTVNIIEFMLDALAFGGHVLSFGNCLQYSCLQTTLCDLECEVWGPNTHWKEFNREFWAHSACSRNQAWSSWLSAWYPLKKWHTS